MLLFIVVHALSTPSQVTVMPLTLKEHWRQARQLASYKPGRGAEPGSTGLTGYVVAIVASLQLVFVYDMFCAEFK